MLELRNLCKAFRSGPWGVRRVEAVRDVSLSIPAGAAVGLSGRSGSGKTTLARMIVGLESTDSGSILMDGRNVTSLRGIDLREYRRKVQIVFQNPTTSLNPCKRLLRSIQEPLDIHGLCGSGARRLKAIELARQVGLNRDLLERYPHQVSGGEAQRAMIARALILDPKVIVLDEPTSMLDVSVQAQILHLLGDLRMKLHMACLFISHDIEVLRWFCDEVHIMEGGALLD